MRPFSRFVSRVLVYDLAMDQKWYFLCNSWLSVDVGDCVLDKVFPVATEQDRKQFRFFFFLCCTWCPAHYPAHSPARNKYLLK